MVRHAVCQRWLIRNRQDFDRSSALLQNPAAPCRLFDCCVFTNFHLPVSRRRVRKKIKINIPTSPSSLTGIFLGRRAAETQCESERHSNNFINENALGGLKCNLLQLMKNLLGVNTLCECWLPESGWKTRGLGLNNRSRRLRRRQHSPERESGMSNVCKWGLLSRETR